MKARLDSVLRSVVIVLSKSEAEALKSGIISGGVEIIDRDGKILSKRAIEISLKNDCQTRNYIDFLAYGINNNGDARKYEVNISKKAFFELLEKGVVNENKDYAVGVYREGFLVR